MKIQHIRSWEKLRVSYWFLPGLMALVLLGARKLRSRYRRDAEGRIRLITEPRTYRGVVGAAFHQIRQDARGNVAVSLRMLNVIGAISASELPRPFREALREQVEAMYELNRDQLPASRDREDFERHYRWALETLAHGTGEQRPERD